MSIPGVGATLVSGALGIAGLSGIVATLEADHDVPPVAATAYIRAAQSAPCPLDYRWLVAIGAVESGHGRSGGKHLDPETGEVVGGPILSVASAAGPMQFIRSTWDVYKTDGDGDGDAEVDDVDDAAASAAKLLCASNIDKNWEDAVGSYNGGAGWRGYAESRSYVTQVRAHFDALPAYGTTSGSASADPSVLGENGKGLQPEFAQRLARMFAEAPGTITINSGYRDPETQLSLFLASDRSGKWVASASRNADGSVTCNSNHCKGLAADLGFSGTEQEWAHANADRFGLHFPMDYEPWHIEPDPAAALAPTASGKVAEQAGPPKADQVADAVIARVDGLGTSTCKILRDPETPSLGRMCDELGDLAGWVMGE